MEISRIGLIFLFLLSLLILVSSLRQRPRANSKKKRPPGPWALPFVGSIHHMVTSQPQAALRDLADKHGPVMYLRLGQTDTVVVSSPAAAQEVLQANDLDFASRPCLIGPGIICYGNLDVAFAPYGSYWRALRKLCTIELLSARKVRHFASYRERQTMSLVAEIRATAAAAAAAGANKPKPVNIRGLLVSCTNTITSLATFGDVCSQERKEQFLSAVAVALNHSMGFCVSDMFPSLWFVDVVTGVTRRLWRAHRQLDELFDKIIEDCEQRRKERKVKSGGGEDEAAAENDLLSIMLRVRDEEDLEFPFNNTNIKAIIFVGPAL